MLFHEKKAIFTILILSCLQRCINIKAIENNEIIKPEINHANIDCKGKLTKA